MSQPHLARLRKLCLALPEAHEKEAWGAPTFRVKSKLFAHYRNNHHGDGKVAAWIKSDLDEQATLVEGDPEIFFVPAYVGPSGWIGVRLDRKPDWKMVQTLLEQGYRRIAPKKLLAQLDAEA